MRELKFKIFNRSVPVFPANKEMIKPKKRRYERVEVPLMDNISGLGISTLLALNTYDTLSMKAKFKETKHS